MLIMAPPLDLCRTRGHRAERVHLSGCAPPTHPPSPPRTMLSCNPGKEQAGLKQLSGCAYHAPPQNYVACVDTELSGCTWAGVLTIPTQPPPSPPPAPPPPSKSSLLELDLCGRRSTLSGRGAVE